MRIKKYALDLFVLFLFFCAGSAWAVSQSYGIRVTGTTGVVAEDARMAETRVANIHHDFDGRIIPMYFYEPVKYFWYSPGFYGSYDILASGHQLFASATLFSPDYNDSMFVGVPNEDDIYFLQGAPYTVAVRNYENGGIKINYAANYSAGGKQFTLYIVFRWDNSNSYGRLFEHNNWGDPANSFGAVVKPDGDIIVFWEYGSGTNHPDVDTGIHLQPGVWYQMLLGFGVDDVGHWYLELFLFNFTSIDVAGKYVTVDEDKVYFDNAAGYTWFGQAPPVSSTDYYANITVDEVLLFPGVEPISLRKFVMWYFAYNLPNYTFRLKPSFFVTQEFNRYNHFTVAFLFDSYKKFDIQVANLTLANNGIYPYSDYITNIGNYFYAPVFELRRNSTNMFELSALVQDRIYTKSVALDISNTTFDISGAYYVAVFDTVNAYVGYNDEYGVPIYAVLWCDDGAVLAVLDNTTTNPTRIVTVINSVDDNVTVAISVDGVHYATFVVLPGGTLTVALPVGYYYISIDDVEYFVYLSNDFVREVAYITATVIINYYNNNTGLGISFNTFKTYVNDSRVFYNVLQLEVEQTLNIVAMDYFDSIVACAVIYINDTLQYIDIGVNMTQIYISNDRDENVTVAISKNNKNLTLTLPAHYITTVQLVSGLYSVFVESKTIKLSFNLTTTVSQNIIWVQNDKIEKIDANPAVLKIKQTIPQSKIADWVLQAVIFGTITTGISILMYMALSKKRKVKVVKVSLI